MTEFELLERGEFLLYKNGEERMAGLMEVEEVDEDCTAVRGNGYHYDVDELLENNLRKKLMVDLEGETTFDIFDLMFSTEHREGEKIIDGSYEIVDAPVPEEAFVFLENWYESNQYEKLKKGKGQKEDLLKEFLEESEYIPEDVNLDEI